jgi:hypothetical protein
MPALTALRLAAVLGLLISLSVLLANLTQTWDTFNPSYWGYYLQQQLARPLIGLGLALITLLFARPLARWIARD